MEFGRIAFLLAAVRVLCSRPAADRVVLHLGWIALRRRFPPVVVAAIFQKGSTIITTPAMIANRPDGVRVFVTASI